MSNPNKKDKRPKRPIIDSCECLDCQKAKQSEQKKDNFEKINQKSEEKNGRRGPAGIDGNTGPVGEKGEKGEMGPMGPTGEKGEAQEKRTFFQSFQDSNSDHFAVNSDSKILIFYFYPSEKIKSLIVTGFTDPNTSIKIDVLISDENEKIISSDTLEGNPGVCIFENNIELNSDGGILMIKASKDPKSKNTGIYSVYGELSKN